MHVIFLSDARGRLSIYVSYAACRSKERANEAINEIVVRNKKQSKPHSLEFLQLDVSSIDSVRDFVNEVKRKNYKITLLINNAGVMFVPETYSKDGIEMHFAANYLGHFLLTYLLLPTLIMNGPSRVIYVTSDTFQFAKPLTDPSNLTKPKKYSRFEAYATSKLCIQLAVVELVERLRRANLQNKLSVWTVHPGAVSTKIGREFPPVVNWLWNLVDILFPFFLKSPKEVVPFWLQAFTLAKLNTFCHAQGAHTIVYTALSPDLIGKSGLYMASYSSQKQPDFAVNKKHAQLLWEFSENLCGVNWKEIITALDTKPLVISKWKLLFGIATSENKQGDNMTYTDFDDRKSSFCSWTEEMRD
jgi:NAD(P)-dependent dehydrogenase (short-subunit alcohol dehydrogenase family)